MTSSTNASGAIPLFTLSLQIACYIFYGQNIWEFCNFWGVFVLEEEKVWHLESGRRTRSLWMLGNCCWKSKIIKTSKLHKFLLHCNHYHCFLRHHHHLCWHHMVSIRNKFIVCCKFCFVLVLLFYKYWWIFSAKIFCNVFCAIQK